MNPQTHPAQLYQIVVLLKMQGIMTQLETVQVSINDSMDIREYYSAIKEGKQLIQAITWVSLKRTLY